MPSIKNASVLLVTFCPQLSLRDQHCAIHEASGEQGHLPGPQHDSTGQFYLKANMIIRKDKLTMVRVIRW